ncbi:hypothetical protein ACED29_09430 [Shewanella sp. 5S214]|uniref:hypothetical protein n=1 Tax=Shewanella sp. 5S214 TaxID=3229999 RepID=UPI00352CDFF4
MYAFAACSILLMLGDIILRKKQVSFSLLIFLFLTLVVTVLSSFVNNEVNSINSAVKMIIILCFSFVYCTNYTIEKSISSSLNIIFVLAIVSLVLYFSVNLMGVSVPSLKIINSNDVVYHYSGVYSYFDGFMQFRNNSIFWEPGIYASFLIIALYMELFFYNNERKTRIFIFVTALITTLSSAGIILFFLYIISIIIRFRVSAKSLFSILVGFIVFAGAIYMVIDVINSHGIDPMRSINKVINPSDTESERMTSPINLLHIFYLNPYFGLGLDGALNEYTKIAKISLTSTSLTYFACFGIMSFIFVFPALLFLYLTRTFIIQAAIVTLVYFLIINKELHLFFISQYLIMFYIVSSSNIKKFIKNE